MIDEYSEHLIGLREIVASARSFHKEFDEVRKEWDYYQAQIRYVFGDNPDNEGPNAIISAADAYLSTLNSYSAIQNKGDRSILLVFQPQQNEYDQLVGGFSRWWQASQARLEEVKKTVQ